MPPIHRLRVVTAWRKMTEPKLPTVKTTPTPEVLPPSSRSLSGATNRLNRPLMILSVGAAAGAVAMFTLTHFAVFSGLLAVSALMLFVARQLVQKSIALTTSADAAPLSSVEERLDHIRKQVSKAKFLENIELEGTQAAHQADLLVQQYKNLREALLRKLSPSELTFQRYQDGISDACLAIGENLIHIKNMLENVNLTPKNAISAEQKRPILELLQSTDSALKQLAQLFQSINDMNTQEKHRDQLENSLQRIQELADRAKIYSKS